MADTVEGLVIEIESNAGSAGSQLDALAAKLENLKRVVGSSTPLKTFSKNYTEMITSINSNGFDITKMEGLSAFTQFVNRISQSKSSMRTFAKNYEMMANSVNALDLDASRVAAMQSFITIMSGMNNIKVSSTIPKQLDNLNFVMQNINVESVSGLESMINALAKLSAVNGIKISSSITNQLERIAELAKNIQGYDFTKLSELTAAISQLGALSGISGENVSKLVTSVKQFSNATKSASSRGRTFNTVLANIRTRTLLLVRATQMIRRATTQALGVYGDYIETLNLFKMAMGSAGEEAYEFAEKAQSLLGIDLTQWMKAQGVFNALASGFGVAGDRAAIMSKNLTQLAYDISSFYNIDVDTAVEKVRSGFSGQIRPVRDLGYDLSQARLEAIALSMGIDKTVKSMTQAEKSQLRYIALMTQLTQVQGDLSRTLDSPINQMRILQAQLQQMYRSIGMTLLPILNKVLPYLNAILRVIKMIADEIAAMFGYTLPRISSGDWSSSVVMGAEDIEEELDNATGAAEKLKNTLASFDQINLISSSSGGGSGSGAGATGGGGGFDFDLPEYDFLGDVAENKAQEIAEGMMRKLRPFVDFLKDTIMWTKDHLDELGHLLEIIAVVTIGKNLLEKLQNAVKWFNELSNVVKGIGLLTIGFQLSYLGGKSLANGDWLKGALESILGVAAAAVGGYLLFGAVGLAVAVPLSLAFILKGYDDQQRENLRQDIMDLFHSFDEGKVSVDELSKSWSEFTDKFKNTEWLDKYTGEGRNDVIQVGYAINNLQNAYHQGLIDAEYYVEEMTTKFGDLKESVLGYLDESKQAITEQLQGALGAFLLTLGYTQAEIDEMIDASTANTTLKLEEISKSVEDARAEFAETKDIEKYQKAIDDAGKKIMEYYGSSGLMASSVKEFNNSMDVFKNGISLDSLDDVMAAIEKINTDYDSAIKSLHDERDQTVQYFQAFVADMPPEMQERYQGLIESVKKYFGDQEEELKQGYRDTMGILEDESVGRWNSIFDVDGLGGVMVVYDEFLGQMNEAIESSYKKRGISSDNTVWGEITSLMKEATKSVEDFEGTSIFSDGSFLDGFDEKAKKVRNASISIDDFAEAVHRNEKTVPKYIADMWKKVINENSTEGDKFTKEGALIVQGVTTEYANLSNNVPESIRRMAEKSMGYTDDARRSLTSITSNTVFSMLQVYKENGKEIPEEFKRIMAKTQDAIKPADFGLKGASVTKNFMDSFKKDFTPIKTVEDFKTKFSNMFQGDDAKKWGEQLGLNVKSGIDSGLSGAETGVENALKGAKTVLDRFGASSAQYWANMSSNIISLMSALMKNPTSFANKTVSFALESIMRNMTWSMKGFAKGGFPDSADFFYANENGVPEYIGTMGGRTAVANNTEIAKGIADAVVKAIRDTGIASDVKKIASKDGKIVFAPSEEAGRVMAQSVNMYNSTGGRY